MIKSTSPLDSQAPTFKYKLLARNKFCYSTNIIVMNNVEDDYGSLCTFAATGINPHFQSIYLCHTCNNTNKKLNTPPPDNKNKNGLVVGNGDEVDEFSSSVPLCICTNCAEICHHGHDVEYIGEGHAYCDCSTYVQPNQDHQCCNLISGSINIAKKLNLCRHDSELLVEHNMLGIHAPIVPKKKTTKETSSSSQFPFVCDIYDIPSIQPCCDTLIEQAQELVKHSRDTHWVSCRKQNTMCCDSNSSSSSNQSEMDNMKKNVHDDDQLCDLEKLAYSIFQRHVIAYNLQNTTTDNTVNIENSLLSNNMDSSIDFGAEWWVQVKQTNDEAIDLHYDKDEELASAFDLGSFPTMSTVTYLTEGSFGMNSEGLSTSAPPTLIFAHTHEMVDEGPMGQSIIYENQEEQEEKEEGLKGTKSEKAPQLMISHARKGKHLCFDGRLLHGASTDSKLRQCHVDKHSHEHEDTALSKKDGLRVTFLVNIWLSRKPSGISVLSEDIRSRIKRRKIHSHYSHIDAISFSSSSPSNTLEMIEREPDICVVQNGSDRDRIHLPFVSSDATWIGDEKGEVEKSVVEDDNDESHQVSGLVVSLVPPPPLQLSTMFVDTVLVYFDEGLEPLLEHLGDDDEDEEEEEEEVGENDGFFKDDQKMAAYE